MYELLTNRNMRNTILQNVYGVMGIITLCYIFWDTTLEEVVMDYFVCNIEYGDFGNLIECIFLFTASVMGIINTVKIDKKIIYNAMNVRYQTR